MSSTRTIYARVFAPDPQHEKEGKDVRVMIYEKEDQSDRAAQLAKSTNGVKRVYNLIIVSKLTSSLILHHPLSLAITTAFR